MENPYTFGGPIHKPADFVGREKEIRHLISHLTNKQNVSIVGERKTGKTSLLLQFYRPPVFGDLNFNLQDYLFVYINCQFFNKNSTPEDFWRFALEKLRAEIPIEELKTLVDNMLKAGQINNVIVDNFLSRVNSHGLRTVLLIDEFEFIALDNLLFDHDFFHGLRALFNEQKITVITASRKPLNEFHSTNDTVSRFFNTFAVVPVGLFTDYEADKVINKGLSSISPTMKKYLKDLSGCYPFFLQMACFYLFLENETAGQAVSSLRSYVREQLALQGAGLHFPDFWNESSDNEKLALHALAVLQAGQGDHPVFSPLEKIRTLGIPEEAIKEIGNSLSQRCLVIQDNNRYRLFSPVLAKWIVDKFLSVTTIAEPMDNVKSQERRIQILHISDIHLGTLEDAALYLGQLVTDLKNEMQVEKLNYIIISGDIASYATSEEYRAAYELIAGLADKMMVELDHVVIAPGNHDLNWSLSEDAYNVFIPLSRLPASLPTEKYVLLKDQNLRDRGALLRTEDLYLKRFGNFSSFYDCICNGLPYPLDPAQQGILHFFPDNKILFLTLNSCWKIDHLFPNRANIYPVALSNALLKLEKNQHSDWLKIAIWHHPIHNSEVTIDPSFLETLVVHDFEVCLTGHVHKAIKDYYYYDDPRGMSIIGAGTFGALTGEMTSAIPWQYNLLTFDKESNKIVVNTRKRENQYGAWSADARWGSKRKPQPWYAIKLRKDHR